MKVLMLGVAWLVILAVGGASDPACPISDEDRSPYHSLQKEADRCITALHSPLQAALDLAVNSTQIRDAYRTFCSHLPELKLCLASLQPQASLCLTPVLRSRLDLYCALKLLNVEVGCSGDHGERLVLIYEGSERFGANTPKRRSPVDACRTSADHSVWTGIDRDPNLGMILEFFLLQNSKECLEKHRGGEDDTLVNAGLSLWTEMLDNMQCVDHEQRVLCKTIVSSAVAS